ncbi:MAG: NAD(P)/FAD-dependent oxidoreductase, partial [Nitrospirae bacterium]
MVDMDFDLLIIGAGAAGYSAALRASELGKTALMVNDPDEVPLGGTCVNVGCIPSKTLLYQAALGWQALRSTFQSLALSGKMDLAKALEETRNTVSRMQKSNYQDTLNAMNTVTYIEDRARLVDEHTIEVSGRRYTGHYILIATGARPYVPTVEGLSDLDYLTHRNVFNLKEPPESLIVLGGGPEALELGQAFHRFGVRTTIIQRSERILTKFDPLVAETLQKALLSEGLEIITGTKLLKV